MKRCAQDDVQWERYDHSRGEGLVEDSAGLHDQKRNGSSRWPLEVGFEASRGLRHFLCLELIDGNCLIVTSACVIWIQCKNGRGCRRAVFWAVCSMVYHMHVGDAASISWRCLEVGSSCMMRKLIKNGSNTYSPQFGNTQIGHMERAMAQWAPGQSTPASRHGRHPRRPQKVPRRAHSVKPHLAPLGTHGGGKGTSNLEAHSPLWLIG